MVHGVNADHRLQWEVGVNPLQAMVYAQVLSPIFDPTFSDSSFGFRPDTLWTQCFNIIPCPFLDH